MFCTRLVVSLTTLKVGGASTKKIKTSFHFAFHSLSRIFAKEDKCVMKYKLKAPKNIAADIMLPASKSISNRALIVQALTPGCPLPDNLSDCDDTTAMLDALNGNDNDNDNANVDIGAAGTAMRFLTAYYAVTEGEHWLTGTERMRQRPIGLLVDALRHLGAEIAYDGAEGFPPLHIKGKKIDGGYIEMPGNISSQYVSALLMIGPTLKKGLTLRLTGDIVSKPYIDLTLGVMGNYGAEAAWTDVDTLSVVPHGYKPAPFFIESDWSAASYWYEAMALSGDAGSEVRLQGLSDGSRQGDAVVRYIFSTLGVRTVFNPSSDKKDSAITLSLHDRLMPRIDIDFTSSPDLAQTLVATCIGLEIPFHFTGLESLRIKETDRTRALQNECGKLGFVLEAAGNGELSWNGTRKEVTSTIIDTYDDHRMAMAMAPLCHKFEGLTINHPEVVSKSYPHFWDDMKKAGYEIEELND